MLRAAQISSDTGGFRVFRSLVRWLCLGLAGGCLTGASIEFERVADEAQRVVVLANANDPESVALAHYYMEKRGIPEANLVSLGMPLGEEIDWREFVILIQEPLQTWLLDRGWLNAVVMDLRDDAGRRRLSVSSHRISYLVTCRGVPLKIRQTAGMPVDGGTLLRPSFKTNRAALDSELSLLAQTDSKLEGTLRNPLFLKSKPYPWERSTVVRVSRLDGPTYSAIRNLVDSAIEVERRGLIGRAIVDVGGPYPLGDRWFESAAKVLTGAGWAPSVDTKKSTLLATARVDDVAIYLGWYAGNLNGPFALPNFRFASGAVALHLHSFSASSLRLINGGGWSGPLVERGVAAVFGNVYEPYLEYTHQPQLIAEALTSGATLGESAYYAIPVLSWQSLVIGDPLYRPMAVSVNEQWEQRDKLSAKEASYVELRRLAAVDLGRPAEELAAALTEAVAVMRKTPSLALALEIGRRREAAGDRAGAVRELGLATHLGRIQTSEWGLVAEMAGQLNAWEAFAPALQVWTNLLNQELPDQVRLAWLREALPTAKAAKLFSVAVEWDQEIGRLVAEAEAKK